MGGINKAIIVGNLGDKPMLKHTGTGSAVTNISVATSHGWNDKQTNERIEKTEWHRVSVFGPIAESVCKYLDKGSKVYVEGKLQTRDWTDNDGIKRYTTEIVISGYDAKIEFLDRKGAVAPSEPATFPYEDMSQYPEIPVPEVTNEPPPKRDDLDEDDIPF